MTEKEALEKLEFFKNAIISLKGRASELEREVEGYKDEARKAKNELNLCKSETEGLNHKNRRLQDDINYLEKTIAEMKENNSPNKEVEKEFAEYKAEAEEKLKACDENIEALLRYKEWYTNLVSKQNDANNNIAELKNKLKETEKEIEKHKNSDIAEVKNKLVEAEKEIEKYKNAIVEKDKKIASLETALADRSVSENVMIVKSAERELKEMIDQS